MAHSVELLMSTNVTHDVKRFICTKPTGFAFRPGQGVELRIDDPRWQKKSRPFTPTSLPEDPLLEFTIKAYPEHDGVTQALHGLSPGAKLTISDPFGAIEYRGPGVFIAGGAGITPFLAILRQLARDNLLHNQRLLFGNRTAADIICHQELLAYLGERATFLLSREKAADHPHGRVDKAFLRQQIERFDKPFYVCGPPDFMETVTDALKACGADPQQLVFEE